MSELTNHIDAIVAERIRSRAAASLDELRMKIVDALQAVGVSYADARELSRGVVFAAENRAHARMRAIVFEEIAERITG